MTVAFSIKPTCSPRAAVAGCTALILLFGILSYSAVLTKSATYDEPYHTLAAWTNLRLGDFRMDYPNPPLSFYLAALPNGPDAIHFDTHDPNWTRIPGDNQAAWTLASAALFQVPGNNGAAFVNRARFMMLFLGVGLGVLIVIWSWQLAGAAAAIVAVTLYALDPNFLGHASLIKNDVAMAIGVLATFLTAWHVGRRLTVARAVLFSLVVAAAMNAKFSALALAPLLAMLLGIRALLPTPWPMPGRIATGIGSKLAAAGLLLLMCAVVTFVVTWASYRFRFNPTPDPAVQLDMQLNIDELMFRRFQVLHPSPSQQTFDPTVPWDQVVREFAENVAAIEKASSDAATGLAQATLPPTLHRQLKRHVDEGIKISQISRANWEAVRQSPAPATESSERELRAAIYGANGLIQKSLHNLQLVEYCINQPPEEKDLFLNLARFAMDHRLMPAAWIDGVLSVYANNTTRLNFLLGKIEATGRWYYFPLAILFKTPVATLVSIVLALMAAIGASIGQRREFSQYIWSAACLTLPAVSFMVLAMRANINLGLRHVLLVYPFIYIGVAIVAADAMQRSRRAKWLATALGLMLAIETLWAWPNYIAFFNFASIARYDRTELLGDSNLDWGQDLPALAQWQREHGGVRIGLAFFGALDPAYYGIQYDMLPPWPPSHEFLATHVIAVSATGLQGIYDVAFKEYSRLQPFDELGGTIYLYDLRGAR